MSPDDQQSLTHSEDTFSPLPHTRISLPTNGEPYAVDTSGPWLYSAVLGNGRLLACLDENGALAQLFYPHVDTGPHVRSFLIGVQIIDHESEEEKIVWLADTEWAHQLSYIDGAAVAHSTSTHRTLPLQLEQEIFVHHDKDALIKQIRCTNRGDSTFVCKLVIYAGFDFASRRNGQTCYFHPDNASLTFFADKHYISLICDKPVDGFASASNNMNAPDDLFQEITGGQFNGHSYAIGRASGGVRYDLGQIEAGEAATAQVSLCFGSSFEDLAALSTRLTQTKPRIEETIQWWQERYTPSLAQISSATIKSVYHRSLMTLKLLTDSQTGGILAAPECDPDFLSCGGYGFCWPRDGAFIAHTLDRTGQHEHARAFYDWALRTQETSGCWYQRYYMHGALAPTWGLIQFDEIGAIVWAMCRHIEQTDDSAYGQQVYSQLARACEYMQKELDVETGLAPVSYDLWEEREEISTYACACTWAAFNAFAHLSSRLGSTDEANHWHEVATRFKQAIEKHLWDDAQKCFLRGSKTRISATDVEQLRSKQLVSDSDIMTTTRAGKTTYTLLRDPIVDTSILGLSVPFGVFSSDDPRMIATAETIARELTSPVGGIIRYKGDHYRGGNPWIICTLWLSLQYIHSGQKEQAYNLYNWALKHRTPLDLFSEQIDQHTGKPCWVTPLAWSHAMFLLATEACIEQGMLK
ncbi:MAG TPA: glycoside hydrolase family 15 protein [Ktedonobacteraceae bacterium]|jgi:glucoamylase|nr:glycoside hydrolase family 15 protein [Ktedonobacteraceae bacterium]